MKKQTLILIMCFLLMLLSFAQTCCAEESIDPDKRSSLTLYYRYDNMPFEGVEIKTYRVAEINAYGQLSLTGIFADYPISIQGITSQTEWKQITSTLAAYITADGIKPDHTQKTDKEGKTVYTDILPGMYLTLSVSVKNGERVVIFENFMTVVPRMEQNGKYNYDGVAYPKYSSYVPEPEDAIYKVVKQWKDSGYEDKRPSYVEVDIFKDGVFWSTQKLTSENNWSFSWTSPNKKHIWTVVERNVEQDYTVTIVNDEYTVILTNLYITEGGDPPPTGEMNTLWLPVLIMGLSGGIIMLLAMWRKRLEE